MALRVALLRRGARRAVGSNAWAQSAVPTSSSSSTTPVPTRKRSAIITPRPASSRRADIVHLTAPVTDGVTREVYEAAIQQPIAAWLAKHLLQDQILYIVLTKGVPLRIDGTGGQDGTVASVDSELTLLYRRMTGVTRLSGRDASTIPTILGDKPLSEARRFTRIDVRHLPGHAPRRIHRG